MAQQHDGSPRERTGWQFFLLPLARNDDGSVRRWMTMLFAAVTGLLLLVCANVAGLVLVRATERQFDFPCAWRWAPAVFELGGRR
jgi:hypothetical protein